MKSQKSDLIQWSISSNVDVSYVVSSFDKVMKEIKKEYKNIAVFLVMGKQKSHNYDQAYYW